MQCKKEKGFTLVEVMMTLFIASVTLAAMLSVLTKMNHKSIGTESNALNCIQSNAAGIDFDATTGNITGLPSSGDCYAAYYGCMKGRANICSTLFSYADGAGDSNQTISALKILRASCDNGGDEACSYFNKRCFANQTNCYSPDQNFTLRYYLNLSSDIANAGRSYVETTGIDYYKWGTSIYNNEIDAVCSTCPGTVTACDIKCNTESSSTPPPPTAPVLPTCDGGWQVASMCVASSDESGEYNWSPAVTQCASKGTGWRLPTKTELNYIYENRASLGTFQSYMYWSSTEYMSTYAWGQTMCPAITSCFNQSYVPKSFMPMPIRCVK